LHTINLLLEKKRRRRSISHQINANTARYGSYIYMREIILLGNDSSFQRCGVAQSIYSTR
jgi:hypothetical protein